ncbi:AprI/Inh family metalloprotease inhibitor [Rhizomicrobium electricum]|uniref:Alkaline proteinase inhibitor/ Outer membrane lipoprotein Omp19 domain-containing protein n=1 Tax=Rhizomicrobium electricum TaxID=480070 RepID=A0ABN1EXR2_9PROT|nr:AprI/Inh family metalloprotease inhibitor [Rhizomicrobium electricum]NIJ49896.1 hypothetical protein [Rhizomicrobium electricum]
MRIAFIAALVACAVPAMAQGIGGSSQQATTTTETTTTKTQSGDTTTTTTTTRSETTSAGGGFTLGNMFGHPPAPSAPTYESLGGQWKIGEAAGNKICDLTLESKKFISNYGARTSIGCPDGMFGVSSWLLLGDEVRLMSPGGSVLAKLHPGPNGRWRGKTEQGLEIFMARD